MNYPPGENSTLLSLLCNNKVRKPQTMAIKFSGQIVATYYVHY